MQELVTQNQNAMLSQLSQKAGLPSSVNAGAVSIEVERAVAEARGKMQLAKMFPRDLTRAHAELMQACKSPSFAAAAFYNVPRGQGSVSGPSIRLAEEVARVVGNFQYGHRELSRDDKKSEVEVFAWDVENNNLSTRQITVMHVIDTKQGPKACRDQKEIDDKISNVASKQLRGRILALVPKWLLEDAVAACKLTLTGGNDEPIAVRVRRMTQAFAKYGVTTEHLAAYLGHKLDEVMLDELVDLQGVFNAIKEGVPPSDFFGVKDEPATEQAAAEPAANAIQQAADTNAKRKAAAEAKKQQAAQAAQAAQAQQQAAANVSAPEQTSAEVVVNTNQPDQKVSNPDQEISNPVKAEPAQTQAEATPADTAPAVQQEHGNGVEAPDDGDVF